MRISDWSSDVCSSDLLGDLAEGPYGLRERDVDALVAGALLGHVEGLGEELLDLPRPGHGDLVVLRELVHAEDRDDVLDRKSVVEGKSESVRVDLGGRWNLKKKNKT